MSTDTRRQVVINVSEWTRLREIDAYADRRNVSRATAIAELVNAALSHGLDNR